MIQQRWRSKAVWISTFALIGIILKNTYDIDMKEFDTIADTILILLTQLGILNNPTRSDKL